MIQGVLSGWLETQAARHQYEAQRTKSVLQRETAENNSGRSPLDNIIDMLIGVSACVAFLMLNARVSGADCI